MGKDPTVPWKSHLIPGRAVCQGHPEDAQQRICSLWKLWNPSLTATLGLPLLESLQISPYTQPRAGISALALFGHSVAPTRNFAFQDQGLGMGSVPGDQEGQGPSATPGAMWVLLQLLEWDQQDPAPLCRASTNSGKITEQRQAGHGGRSDREHREHREGEARSQDEPCSDTAAVTPRAALEVTAHPLCHFPSRETTRSQRDSRSEETPAGSAATPKARGR